MEYFTYGEKEIAYLKSKDKRLGAYIDQVGMIQRPVHRDLFDNLVRCIVAQQISTKAAITVMERLRQRVGQCTPQTIGALSAEEIQSCGMSLRKAGYIKGAAQAVLEGRLEIDRFPQLEDQEIIRQLSSLSGIGVWTAEMLMIFSLERMDILSYGDLGIRRGMMRLYHHKEITKERFERYRRRYSPYGSVASLYLWRMAAMVED